MHLPYKASSSKFELLYRSLLARENVLKTLKENLVRARNRMKQLADKNRTDREFQVNDWVYIKLQPYRQTSVNKSINQKLFAKYFGPYQVIEKVGRVAYQVQLPAEAKIHNVFHISQLKKKIGEQSVTATWPECLTGKGEDVRAPVAILERQLVKRGNGARVKLLV